MKKEFIAPAGHPAPRGAYSPAIKVDLGTATMLFVTGQLALNAEGMVVAPDDAGLQTEFVFGLLAKILAEAGMAFDDVVRVQTYLTTIGDYQAFTVVRDRHLGDSRPASTLLEVKGLAHRGCCVEIEITALKAN